MAIPNPVVKFTCEDYLNTPEDKAPVSWPLAGNTILPTRRFRREFVREIDESEILQSGDSWGAGDKIVTSFWTEN